MPEEPIQVVAESSPKEDSHMEAQSKPQSSDNEISKALDDKKVCHLFISWASSRHLGYVAITTTRLSHQVEESIPLL